MTALKPCTPISALTEKQRATYIAELALRGVQAVPCTDDHGRATLVVSRWGLTRELVTVEELDGFLARIGGAHVG